MKRFLLMLGFSLVILGTAFAKTEPKELLEAYAAKENLELWDFTEGNFTNSQKTEVIGFFRQKDSELVEKVFCFVIDKKIKKIYEIPFNDNLCIQMDEWFGFLPVEPLGQVKPFGWVADYNKNGTDELYICAFHYLEIYPKIYEFIDGNFKLILDSKIGRRNNYPINDYLQAVSKKEIGINIDRLNVEENVHISVYYRWNPRTNMFEDSNTYIPYILNNGSYQLILDRILTNGDGKRFMWNRKTHTLDALTDEDQENPENLPQ